MRQVLLPLLLLLGLLTACRSLPTPPPIHMTPGPTGISGQVHDHRGQPAGSGFVYAYRSPRGGLRGPADFEATIDAEGRYFLDLVEGRYYLVARLRHGGADVGPPRPGDAWSIHPRNPVTVVAGQTSVADFTLQGVAQPMLFREGSLSSGDTGFSGQIVDSAGVPVAGAFALAYRDADYRRMPDFTSAAVGADGHFTLYVPQAGRYCLAARTRTRGQPSSGEPYGLLGDGASGCREVVAGEILEIGAIVVTPYRK